MKLRQKSVPHLKFHPGFITGGLLLAGYLLIRLRPGLLSLPCTWKSLTGLSCPTCGSSRAINALMNGDGIAAFFFNPLLLLFLGAAVAMSIAAGYQLITGKRLFFTLSENTQRLLRYLLFTLIIAQTLWRWLFPI